MKGGQLVMSQPVTWRNIPITLKIPQTDTRLCPISEPVATFVRRSSSGSGYYNSGDSIAGDPRSVRPAPEQQCAIRPAEAE